MFIYYVIPDEVFRFTDLSQNYVLIGGGSLQLILLLQKKSRGGLQNDHQSIKPWLWKQRFELQHRNFSGQVIEVTLILPFHKQARAQMRCKRSKWSSNFKWPQPNYVFTSCFSISLEMKLTIKCLWTVSLGQLRELKKSI